MLRFIWRGWWKRKERLILMLIGVLVISSGLSYLVMASESNKGTVVDILRKNWDAQYHILVRPPGSRSQTESKKLLSPNYLSGLSGGISMEQYQSIKDMKDIDVAAPLASVGYLNYNVTFSPYNRVDFPKNEIYRQLNQRMVNHGSKQQVVATEQNYFTTYPQLMADKTFNFSERDKASVSGYLLIAGIDPEEEAKLTGLDTAVLKKGDGRYFNQDDQPSVRVTKADKKSHIPEQQHTQLPILLSNQYSGDFTDVETIEKLNLDMSNISTLKKKLNETPNKWDYLNGIDGDAQGTYNYYSKDVYQILIDELTQQPIENKDKYKTLPEVSFGNALNYRPSGLKYADIATPYQDRWPYAFEIQPQLNQNHSPIHLPDGYRKVEVINDWSKDHRFELKQYVKPKVIGVYDPTHLHVATNPLSKLPMQTYAPPTAKLVLGPDDKPINPPQTVGPNGDVAGFLMEPPSMLTTIDAAEKILGDKPISSIRIKVKGVDTFTEDSQKRLQTIADKIEKKTGLIADVTLGSSPQPTLLHVPASGDYQELGWIEMPWIKLGTTMTIFKETKTGFSGIIIAVMLVAVAYVLATNLVSFLARRKEFAVLMATGWRITNIVKLVVMESLLLGGTVAAIAIVVGGYFLWKDPNATFLKIGVVALLGLLIYLLGAIGPIILAYRISPYETIKTGEIHVSRKRMFRSSGIWAMALNHLFGKLGRNTLSILAMIFPTTLLAFFIFITLRLQGVLYTTWLGQYTATEVGPTQYIAMATALLIAVLTSAELTWQNVVERKAEVALLKALGWRNGAVRRLILLEGFWTGILAGTMSMIIALSMITIVYGKIPYDQLVYILPVGFVPVIVNLIGAWLPSEVAVRIKPSLGMKE